jgi:hypothetical protein
LRHRGCREYKSQSQSQSAHLNPSHYNLVNSDLAVGQAIGFFCGLPPGKVNVPFCRHIALYETGG